MLAPPDTIGNATVVPLLHGVEHMTPLLPAPIGDPRACASGAGRDAGLDAAEPEFEGDRTERLVTAF